MLTSEQYLELISRLDKIIQLLERLNAQHAEHVPPGFYITNEPLPDYKKSHEISFDPTWDDKP